MRPEPIRPTKESAMVDIRKIVITRELVLGEGNTLPLTRVYGKMSGSSRLINCGPAPGHSWTIRRWYICTGHPRNVNRREIG